MVTYFVSFVMVIDAKTSVLLYLKCPPPPEKNFYITLYTTLDQFTYFSHCSFSIPLLFQAYDNE